MKISYLAIFLVAAATIAIPAQARLWTWDDVPIDGLQETPPVATPGFGTGDVTYDDSSGLLSWNISYSGLIGSPTLAHFHGPAPPGTPAGIRVDIAGNSGGVASPMIGSTSITPAFGTELLDGLWYINIHSTFRPGGEIRGQLHAIPEPATCAMLAMAVVGLLAGRRRSR